RSIAFVVRALPCEGGSRVKVKSCSPASSKLLATAQHLRRHLRVKAWRRVATSFAGLALIMSEKSDDTSSASCFGACAIRLRSLCTVQRWARRSDQRLASAFSSARCPVHDRQLRLL